MIQDSSNVVTRLYFSTKDYILKDSFSRGVIALAGGASVSQLVSVLSIPIITRIYPPSVFALLGIFTSAISIFSPFTTGRYELAILAEKNEEKTSQLLSLIFLLSTISGILAFLAILLLGSTMYSIEVMI